MYQFNAVFAAVLMVCAAAQEVGSNGNMYPLPRSNVVNSEYLVIDATSPDLNGPTLTNFTVYGTEAPTALSSIQFSLQITDGTGVGVAAYWVHVYYNDKRLSSVTGHIATCPGCGLYQALFYQRCDCTESSALPVPPVTGPWPNGATQTSGYLSTPFIYNGTYELVVQVIDRNGNIRMYDRQALEIAGFVGQFDVYSAASVVMDTSAPSLTQVSYSEFSFLWNPAPMYEPDIEVTINATDSGEGLFRYQWAFRPQRFAPVILNGQYPELAGSATESAKGVRVGGKVIRAAGVDEDGPAVPSGQYDLLLAVSDWQLNTAFYSAADLLGMGLSAQMLVSGGSADHVAPTCDLLAALVPTPGPVNPLIISFDGAAFCRDNDGGVGLEAYYVIIQGPGPNPMQYTVRGEPGLPAQLHLLRESSVPGLYSILGLIVWDQVGNMRGYGQCQSWYVNMYQTQPGLDKFYPTVCDLSYVSVDSSVVRAGWIAAVAIMGVMFFSILILSIRQCQRDGLCDCCCGCCSCCYRRNQSPTQFSPVKFGLGGATS